jgi:hypothetical protein
MVRPGRGAVLAGSFATEFELGVFEAKNLGGSDGVTVAIDPDGLPEALRVIGGLGDDTLSAIAAASDPECQVYVTGSKTVDGSSDLLIERL